MDWCGRILSVYTCLTRPRTTDQTTQTSSNKQGNTLTFFDSDVLKNPGKMKKHTQKPLEKGHQNIYFFFFKKKKKTLKKHKTPEVRKTRSRGFPSARHPSAVSVDQRPHRIPNQSLCTRHALVSCRKGLYKGALRKGPTLDLHGKVCRFFKSVYIQSCDQTRFDDTIVSKKGSFSRGFDPHRFFFQNSLHLLRLSKTTSHWQDMIEQSIRFKESLLWPIIKKM